MVKKKTTCFTQVLKYFPHGDRKLEITNTKTKIEKLMSIGNQQRVLRSSPVGTSFLWSEGFVEKIGFESGMKNGTIRCSFDRLHFVNASIFIKILTDSSYGRRFCIFY